MIMTKKQNKIYQSFLLQCQTTIERQLSQTKTNTYDDEIAKVDEPALTARTENLFELRVRQLIRRQTDKESVDEGKETTLFKNDKCKRATCLDLLLLSA